MAKTQSLTKSLILAKLASVLIVVSIDVVLNLLNTRLLIRHYDAIKRILATGDAVITGLISKNGGSKD